MKVTLYIRAGKHGRVNMWTRREEEPNYGDTVRIVGFGHDIGGKCVTDISKFPEHLRIRQVPWTAEKATATARKSTEG